MDSLQASRIAGGNSAIGRRESDFYPTPPDDGYYGRRPHNTNVMVHGYEKPCGLFDARKVGGGDG